MTRKQQHKKPGHTPLRTREHHIADLSLNHVEWFVLREGWIVEAKQKDYGYDLVMTTFDYAGDAHFARGMVEPGEVLIQLKATDHFTVLKDDITIAFDVDVRHLNLWSREIMPVILIVYDVTKDKAYWLYIQNYFKPEGPGIPQTQEEMTLHIPKSNIVNGEAIRKFRDFKETTMKHIQEKLRLHE